MCLLSQPGAATDLATRVLAIDWGPVAAWAGAAATLLAVIVDPVQLRWAGLPRSRAFDPIGLGRHQREYLNVLFLSSGARWRLVTFEDPDFDPGFATELPRDGRHVIRVSVFAENADAVMASLVAEARPGVNEPLLQLL